MRGIWSKPTAKGEVEGDLVQAHSQGEVEGDLTGGCLLRGVLLWGVLRPPCDGYCCRWYTFYWNAFLFFHIKSGADPGFPIGGAPTLQEGAPAYKFDRFSEKLHEIKKILVRWGAPGTPPWICHCKCTEIIYRETNWVIHH